MSPALIYDSLIVKGRVLLRFVIPCSSAIITTTTYYDDDNNNNNNVMMMHSVQLLGLEPGLRRACLLGTQALDEDSDWLIEWCVPCLLRGAVRYSGAAGILPYWRGGASGASGILVVSSSCLGLKCLCGPVPLHRRYGRQ